MKTIYKYTLDITQDEPHVLTMPTGAEIIHVQDQYGADQVMLWAVVDTGRESCERRFDIFGTGDQMPEDALHHEHIGSTVTASGSLVWHVFERIG